MDEKIGINIKEASEILGISKQLMTELTKLKDFHCVGFGFTKIRIYNIGSIFYFLIL